MISTKSFPMYLALAAIFILPASIWSATSHAVILVMDGARYTETLGDSTNANVPVIALLAKKGTTFSRFFVTKTNAFGWNRTETVPGHSRLTTGTYQDIANNGSELPTMPSIFQYYRKQKDAPATSCWIICSKDKLAALANTSNPQWNGKFLPSFDCGITGTLKGGYREDSITNKIVKKKLTTDHPALMIVNYKGPDAMGHANNWKGYLAAIKDVDGYVGEIWNVIQSDSILKNTTALFITNDHGRHTTDFREHGDTCYGCRHILGVALGADIKAGYIDTLEREQIDIPTSIATLLGFSMPTAVGKSLFANSLPLNKK